MPEVKGGGSIFSGDPQARKQMKIATAVLDYFPNALAEVAKASLAGNKQHLNGQPLRWDRTKSADHADSLIRHFMERGTLDEDSVRHSAKVAWRALALLQVELELEAAQKEAHLENGPKITVNLGRASDPIPSPAPTTVFYSATRKNSEE